MAINGISLFASCALFQIHISLTKGKFKKMLIQFNSFFVLTATGPYTYIHIITYIYILNKHIIIIIYTGINNETLVYE